MATSDAHLDAYRGVHARLDALARVSDRLDEAVPSCPEWTARDVVAHLAGLCQDWVAGNLDDYGSDAWAGAQVARFARAEIDVVLDAWTESMVGFAALTESPRGGTPAMWGFGDAVVHEADLRPILAPGTRVPDDAVALGVAAGVARWRHHLAATDVAPLKVIAPGTREWWIGDSEAGTDASVTVDTYDLFRATFGRRSRAQIEAWDWSPISDVASYLDPGLPAPFSWADRGVED